MVCLRAPSLTYPRARVQRTPCRCAYSLGAGLTALPAHRAHQFAQAGGPAALFDCHRLRSSLDCPPACLIACLDPLLPVTCLQGQRKALGVPKGRLAARVSTSMHPGAVGAAASCCCQLLLPPAAAAAAGAHSRCSVLCSPPLSCVAICSLVSLVRLVRLVGTPPAARRALASALTSLMYCPCKPRC